MAGAGNKSGNCSDTPKTQPGRHASVLPAALLCLFLPAAILLVPEGATGVRFKQVGYALSAVGWIRLLVQLRRQGGLPGWRAALVVSLVARVLLVMAPPSDDVHRYVWEGRVRLAGFNPYVLAPDDPRLGSLRDENWSRINHPDHPAIYPPLFQVICVAMAAIGADERGFKLLITLADVATIALLMRWLRMRGRSPALALTYALCPLVLTSFSLEGHGDALVALSLAGWLIFCDRGEPAPRLRNLIGGALCLGIGIGCRLIPVVLVPWLLRCACRGATGLLNTLLAMASVLVCTFAPVAVASLFYADTGFEALARPMIRFSVEFSNLDLARDALRLIAPDEVVAGLCLAGIAAAALVAVRFGATAAGLLSIGAAILLAPTIHPWYFAPLAVLICTVRAWAWPALFVALAFAYEGDHVAAATGAWRMPSWVQFAVFGPFVAAAIVDWLRARPTRENQRSPNPPPAAPPS